MAKLPKDFASKLYDVEHALVMYAYSFVQLPAHGIYEPEMLEQFKDVLRNCHVYMIGYVPTVEFLGFERGTGSFVTNLLVLGKKRQLEMELPQGWDVRQEGEFSYLIDPDENRYAPNGSTIASYLSGLPDFYFNIQYIGQAYGQSGERNAIDRLRSHETLQQISLRGVPAGHSLELLLLEVAPANKLVTMFNPHARKKDKGDERIAAGLDKLFGTDEKERVALYEASLIRYFQPPFNKEFKDSFPSTNMKVLEDCYGKDFSMVVSEFNFDNIPYMTGSNVITPAFTHAANFDLHKEADRKVFFSARN